MQNTKTREEDRKAIAAVVDEETGEIINYIYEGDKIVTQKQNEYTRKYITKFQQKEAFVKVFTAPIVKMFKELPSKDFAIAMALMPFISYKDGILRCNNKIADVKMLSDELEQNYDVFRKIINNLIKKKVLAKIRVDSDTYNSRNKTAICVNPYIFLKGQDIERNLAELFKDSQWANVKIIYDDFDKE